MNSTTPTPGLYLLDNHFFAPSSQPISPSKRKFSSHVRSTSGHTPELISQKHLRACKSAELPRMNRPAPPSDKERTLYYLGLPSEPLLIARSSTSRWLEPNEVRPRLIGAADTRHPPQDVYKTFLPVLSHPTLHDQWNDSRSSLRQSILSAVDDINWSTIDILRVGRNNDFPIVLLLSVNPGSVDWVKGYRIVTHCKSILESHNIYDVECEVKESRLQLTAGETDPQVDSATAAVASIDLRLTSQVQIKKFGQYSMNWSEYIGSSISSRDFPGKFGTKGLYLSLAQEGQEPRTVALTCRHVALPEAAGFAEYRYDAEAGEPKRDIIQIAEDVREDWITKIEKDKALYRQTPEATRSAAHKECLDLLEECTTSLQSFYAPESRVIGHVLYSPALETKIDRADSESGAEWLRDWALIDLLPSRHETPLSSLKNKVCFKPHSIDAWEEELRECQISQEEKADGDFAGTFGLPTPKDDTLQLRPHCIPTADLRWRWRRTGEGAPPRPLPLLVAKYGAASQLSFGMCNTLKSVTQRQLRGQVIRSEDLCILGMKRLKPGGGPALSDGGDSGSCIWDMEGNIVGLLQAGDRDELGRDVTYATPMDRLLRDIRSEGFEVSLP